MDNAENTLKKDEENTSTENFERDLVCVLFPGVVKNPEIAIQYLGGINSISEVNQLTNKKRLGLSFQPENPYINRIFADTKQTAGVLLKVKVKKKKVENQIKREVISTTVMGRVGRIFKFDGFGDFQYLPVNSDGVGERQPRCILEEIVPSGLSTLDFLKRENSIPFVTPVYFTRSDKPCTYRYTDKKITGLKETPNAENVVCTKLKSLTYVPLHFNLTDEFPTEPKKDLIQKLNKRVDTLPSLAQDLELIKMKFEERPIWSFNAINYVSKVKRVSLRSIMPVVAIHMADGPWRKLWVKFGYDPRKDPAARFYQTLDFRVRSTAGVNAMVTARKQASSYRKADRVWNTKGSDVIPESSVIFRPGVVLTQRQIYYQYCDIKLPEVQELLAQKPAAGFLCHGTRGWLAPGVPDACRDLIFQYAKQTILTTHNADLKYENSSSGDEQNSDDDYDNDISVNEPGPSSG